jgi:hypothetical protein
MTDKRSDSNATTPKKYSTPELKEFGPIAELTAAIGNMGNQDGGIPPDMSTQL